MRHFRIGFFSGFRLQYRFCYTHRQYFYSFGNFRVFSILNCQLYVYSSTLSWQNILFTIPLMILAIPDPGSWIQPQAHYHNAMLTIHENRKWNEINMLALKLSLLLTTLSSQIFKILFIFNHSKTSNGNVFSSKDEILPLVFQEVNGNTAP
jgi:hypothetical protein